MFGGTASTLGAAYSAYRRVGNGFEIVSSFVVASSGTSGDQVFRYIVPAGVGGWIPDAPLRGYLHSIGVATQMHTDGQVLLLAVSMEYYNGFIVRPMMYVANPTTILGTHVVGGDEFSFHISMRASAGLFGALLDARDTLEPLEET
jgi:hypothetical protein